MSEFFYVDLLVKSGPLNVNSLTWFFNIINRNPTYLRMSVKMILPVDFFPTGLTFSLKWRISSYRFLYLLYLHTSSQRKARENQLLFLFFLKLIWNTLINVQYCRLCALRWSLYIPCKCMVASFIYKAFSIFWFSAFCRCKDGRFSRLRKYCLRCENVHHVDAMCTLLMESGKLFKTDTFRGWKLCCLRTFKCQQLYCGFTIVKCTCFFNVTLISEFLTALSRKHPARDNVCSWMKFMWSCT